MNDNEDESAAYKVGVEQFKTDLNSLRNIFVKNEKLKKNSLVVVSNSGSDGASGLQHLSLAATRHEIYRFADAIFSGNPTDREYFLGQGVDDQAEVKRRYGSLKPCIHGSDAHRIDRICVPDLNRFTWIKAAPTFEGLKQIIYEPQLRVKIQEEDPSESETYAKISKAVIDLPENLEIKDESGEKTSFCVNGKYNLEFSNNLTCIIGERGCGKSTIAHILYNSGMDHASEKLSEIDSPLLKLELSPSPPKKVAECTSCEVPSETEFFFQNEIERAAKSIHSMSKLIRHRLDKLSSIQSECSLEKLEVIWNVSFTRMSRLIEANDEIAKIDESISIANEDKKTLQKQTEVITSEEYKKFQNDIGDLSRSISNFNSYRNDYEGLIEQIDSLKNAVDQINWDKTQGEEILKKLGESLNAYKKELTDKFKFVEVDYNKNNFPTRLNEKKQELRNYLEKRGLSPENVQELADANQKISDLEEEIRLLNLKKAPYVRIHEDKTNIIKDYQSKYDEYKTRFNEIISSLQSKLTCLPISEKQITFELHIDDTQLKVEMVEFIKSNVKDKTNLRDDYIITALSTYIDFNEFVRTGGIKSQIGDMSENRKHMQIVGDLLSDKVLLEKLHLVVLKCWFNLSNIQVQTKLGKQILKNTSFGERCGIVVAIILVAGTNPIVIDQPEDHLGGKFISQVLVQLIRDQKRNRQIILITRDANVVIGGDAELIHILEVLNERTEIITSTIENIEYRDKYIWILDGGEEAFLKREQKYAFSGVMS
ncbi:MAG: hypothetical protein ACFFCW_01015 [Candidatus Hodarchaeota archaeon]